MRFKNFLLEEQQNRTSVIEFLTDELRLDEDDFTIHPDLSVSLFTDLNIENGKATSFKRLPVKFKEIQGSVWISDCKLESLIGLPVKIDGDIIIANTRIKNLRFCPQQLGSNGSLVLQHNRNLVSLEGCPKNVLHDFSLSDCHLITSLEHGPTEVGHNFTVDTCDGLTSINGIASYIGKHLSLTNNRQLKSLTGINKMLKYCGGKLDVSGSRFKSSILGLILIKGFTTIDYKFGSNDALTAFDIIFKSRAAGKDELDCQEELINAGLEEFAKL